jgi:hypothetical protein
MAIMNKIRDGLLGNFIPLADAVRAIGSRISVPIGEVDLHLSLNRPKDEGVVEWQRDAVAYHLRFAHGAARLLQLMNRAADDRPKWYDAASGHSILDDTLGRRGLNILSHWSKLAYPSASNSASGSTSAMPPAHHQGPDGGPMDLGFEVDELIHFLDADQVLHTLGEQLNSVLAEEATESAANDASTAADSQRRKPRFTGPLREVLMIAWKNADDGDDHVAVFGELCEMARVAKPRAPLRRYQDGAVWYEDPDTKLGEACLTVDMLLDRAFFKNKGARIETASAQR